MDGVGNSVLYFNKIFSKNYPTRVVAHYSNIEGVINFEDYTKEHEDNNILLYHYSISDVRILSLLKLKFKKRIVYYHGITPPKYFLKNSELYNNCAKGLEDIYLLNQFDLYISNSNASKNQFLLNTGKTFYEENKFIIMPPIDFKKDLTLPNKDKNEKINAFYCGTLANHKNVKNMIEFFSRDISEFKLNIFTAFSESDAIDVFGEDSFQEFKNKGIKFFHKLSNEEMMVKMLTMNLFVSFSLHEGFCIPVYDSIQSLIPSMTYKLSCYEDYFPSNYKYIDLDDNLINLKEKYFYNLSNIEQTKELINMKGLEKISKGISCIEELIDS